MWLGGMIIHLGSYSKVGMERMTVVQFPNSLINVQIVYEVSKEHSKEEKKVEYPVLPKFKYTYELLEDLVKNGDFYSVGLE